MKQQFIFNLSLQNVKFVIYLLSLECYLQDIFRYKQYFRSCEVAKYLQNSQFLPQTSSCIACVKNSYDCTSCIEINQTVINFKCFCNDGSYIDGSNQCQFCQAPFSKCENNGNYCTDYVLTFTLNQNSQQKFESLYGYFQIFKFMQLINGMKITVYHVLIVINSKYSFLFVCKTGWILDTDDITCIKCQLPCLDCVDTINKCVTCKDTIHQQTESCQSES
ncbi:unnamed protein product [Paramecium pentaurelia]|uniref:Uncharacterized protein n=1 Tax=Paramecium pentaurelia TaxID=43138 RepID=A0A8S1YDL0_9CILI|nr:unnamed protein product [Paramecium pentaurelia]